MSKVITDKQNALNNVTIVGKLVDVVMRNGVTNNMDWQSATMNIQVTQTYGGREETSIVPVSMFANKYTKDNKPNPGWTQINDLQNYPSVQSVGLADAVTLRITKANLRENNYVSKTTGQLINMWQLNTSFVNTTNNTPNTASFVIDIYIMSIDDELDRDGEPTGRLKIQGGIVQYGGTLDVLNFVVENPDSVNFIRANWEVNDTVTVKGRIRVTTAEEKKTSSSSWGEDVPETSVRTIRELVITTGDDCGKDEEFAYSPEDIKKIYQVRKARLEQMQLDSQNKVKSTSTNSAATADKYSWK
jgi:hypothetical protein